MKIPRELYINGEQWVVRFVTLTGMPCGHTRTTLTMGYTCGETQTIYILQKLSARERQITFIHELLHAIEYEYGIDLAHSLIRQLEGPLAQVIAENIA